MIPMLRWGRSAYETDADLAGEESRLGRLGVRMARHEGPNPPLHGVRILSCTSGVRVTDAVLAGADALELVITTTSGAEHIDVTAAAARGVKVARCPLARRDAVVDSSVGMALMLLRAVPSLARRAEQGVWARDELPALAPRTAYGAVVGLVGLGVIGRRAAEVWRALGAEVLFTDPRVPGGVSFDALVEHADILSLHCSLTRGAEAMIDGQVMKRAKPGLILINTARGRCVDPEAVLASPRLAGLGLDVFPTEPPPNLERLARDPRVLLTPHAAGFHPALGEAVAREVEAAVAAWLAGTPLPFEVRPEDQR